MKWVKVIGLFLTTASSLLLSFVLCVPMLVAHIIRTILCWACDHLSDLAKSTMAIISEILERKQ
jgi:hypothetical protein